MLIFGKNNDLSTIEIALYVALIILLTVDFSKYKTRSFEYMVNTKLSMFKSNNPWILILESDKGIL